MRLDICELFRAITFGLLIPMSLVGVLAVVHPRTKQALAVFPPWWNSARIIAAAAQAGQIVALGRLPTTVVVHGDRADVVDRLRAAGALFTFDASRLAGCAAPVPEATP